MTPQSPQSPAAREISVRARLGRRNRVSTLRVLVDPDATVRVWDAVAGHFTLCHSLSEGTLRRIRRAALRAA